jgi:hypothetical protein
MTITELVRGSFFQSKRFALSDAFPPVVVKGSDCAMMPNLAVSLG